ncbi:MAG TPA: YihY/virulence factor BrkB family protein [Candidatus Paceibacterota bacterium]|nr:YihY/virulence factor BrkB family protein [Candidatus Paceibacterota bacterium]
MKYILQETYDHWKKHNATRMGAALSFYTLFSLVPLLVLLIGLASALFDTSVIHQTIVHYISTTLGPRTAIYLSTLLNASPLSAGGTTTLAINLVVLLLGALGMFSELHSDLDQLWEVPPPVQKRRGILGILFDYIRSKIVLLLIIPLLAVLLVLVVGIGAFLSFLQTLLPPSLSITLLITALQFLAPFVFSTLLFVVVYRVLPRRTFSWKVIGMGAVVTAVCFVVGNVLIALYIALLAHIDLFGTAASLVGLLLWTYYAAQVFFFGASYTFVLARRSALMLSRD